jgi:hypothetical protein
MPMPGAVQYQNKGAQSVTGMLRYRTEKPDAGCRNADACGIGLDADIQLYKKDTHFVVIFLFSYRTRKEEN